MKQRKTKLQRIYPSTVDACKRNRGLLEEPGIELTTPQLIDGFVRAGILSLGPAQPKKRWWGKPPWRP